MLPAYHRPGIPTACEKQRTSAKNSRRHAGRRAVAVEYARPRATPSLCGRIWPATTEPAPAPWKSTVHREIRPFTVKSRFSRPNSIFRAGIPFFTVKSRFWR